MMLSHEELVERLRKEIEVEELRLELETLHGHRKRLAKDLHVASEKDQKSYTENFVDELLKSKTFLDLKEQFDKDNGYTPYLDSHHKEKVMLNRDEEKKLGLKMNK